MNAAANLHVALTPHVAHGHGDSAPAWSADLLAASDLRAAADVIVARAQRQFDDVRTTLSWNLDGDGDWAQAPLRLLTAGDTQSIEMALIEKAAAQPGTTISEIVGAERVFARCFASGKARAVVSCAADAAFHAPHAYFDAFFETMQPYLANVLEKSRLNESLEHLGRSEKLQRALFAIVDMAGSELEMPNMLRGLHEIVGGLMYAENFYIALHDADSDTVRFLYFADIADDDKPLPTQSFPMSHFEQGLTWYLIRDGRALMGSNDELEHQVSGPLHTRGPRSYDLLGVPMIRGNTVCGALVVQSYVERQRYTAHDQALLSFVANHILTALERKQAHEELERHVEQRTRELAKANEILTVEAQERRRSEHLQRALYRIAELSHVSGSIEEFYAAVHQIVAELINATNFYIALLSDDRSTLSFPYFVDTLEPSGKAMRPLGSGATEYVLRTGKALLASDADIARLHMQGELEPLGPQPRSWLGVPLICSERAVGVIAVQSYSAEVHYAAGDMELLTFVSYQVASSLERKRAAEALRTANSELEQRVAERTLELREQISVRQLVELALQHRNADLQALNSKLAGTQSQLLQSEKMASVGQLAAGVAHEINNPIGYIHSNLTSLTSYLRDIFSVVDAYEKLERALPSGMPEQVQINALKLHVDLPFLRDDITSLLAESVEGVTRVKKIVDDLKDFSHVDEAEWQYADLHTGLEITLNVARHELKYKAEIVKDYGELPQIECLASQLNQVFLNILVNAAQAIDGRGTITIRTRNEAENVVIEISDNGKGIDAAHINRIFEPFFTTKPVGVGTGLGLSVSYGIIQKHGGTIQAHSEHGQGTTFTIRLPNGARKTSARNNAAPAVNHLSLAEF